jgi:hypothetical protein
MLVAAVAAQHLTLLSQLLEELGEPAAVALAATLVLHP